MEYAGNGLTRISGDVQIYIGSNVTIFDNTIFTGLKVFDKPEVHIGDNTYIGPQVHFLAASEIRIGKHCMIGSNIITDNPGHSVNVLNRLGGKGYPDKEKIKPISIGDFVWLPLGTVVTPGVTIGDGVVAILGAQISTNIPPFCMVAGRPAKIIRKLSIPEEIIAIVGKERYESYLKSHENFEIKG
jgi:acetyltransferase-like isoleucine patch superfamily enzyme